MKTGFSKSGFTLLEMLVASLLLGMLVTILTMIFNSSSVAWRTGKAGVAELLKTRYQLALVQEKARNVLPRINPDNPAQNGTVLSPWKSDGALRERAVAVMQNSELSGLYSLPNWDSRSSAGSNPAKPWAVIRNIATSRTGDADSYTVGVTSAGPDGKFRTADDITTWPSDKNN